MAMAGLRRSALIPPPPCTRHVAACGGHDPTAGPHPPAALTTGSLRGMRVGRGGQRPPPGRRRAAPLSPNRLPGCPLPPPRRPPPSPLACRAAASTPWGAHSGRCCGRRAREWRAGATVRSLSVTGRRRRCRRVASRARRAPLPLLISTQTPGGATTAAVVVVVVVVVVRPLTGDRGRCVWSR